MDIINIPGSLTIETGVFRQNYKWKSLDRTSTYQRKYTRAALRITGLNVIENLYKLNKNKRQIALEFTKDGENWAIIIHRVSRKGLTLQSYIGKHPFAQIIVNKFLPQELKELYLKSKRKTKTFGVYVKLFLKEWRDIDIKHSDFLIQVEKESKTLLECALSSNFTSVYSTKGRAYDLSLISPKGKEFLIAITSYGEKSSELRRKEKIKQKVLYDIAKMLPSLYKHKNAIPIVVSRPMKTEKTWSYTTSDYLNFYENQFNFKFLTTDFKNGWERHICNKLLEIDKNV
ncbi:hypothetical protein HYT57_05480 [Candidatus Woesearchaeota archaeon]|nr:hypothetical protein [Candidatus Woesearchaeota archaeon]